MTSHAYPAIGDHALLGDLRTCALVAGDGTVDWFCPGRFDAPSVFGALVDAEHGGAFRVWANGAVSSAQAYIPDTAVVVTRFTSPDGAVGEVVDFLVPDESGADEGQTRLFRIVRGVEGTMRFSVFCRPQFEYGLPQAAAVLELEQRGAEYGAVFRSRQSALTLFSTVPLIADDDAVVTRIDLAAGEAAVFLVAACAGPTPSEWIQHLGHEAERSLAETLAFWLSWVARSGYRGRWPEAVHRSAITLKLLTHAPTGAIVAGASASTNTSLSEEIDGHRDWDCRRSWIRDGSFSARALLDLGYRDEAEAFARWVTGRLAEGPAAGGEPMCSVYGVDGSSSGQAQLDVYGAFLYSLSSTEHLRSPEGQAAVGKMLDWLVENWRRPDEGFWKTRGERRDFIYSRLMCWAAFEYGLRLAPTHENAGMWAVMAHAAADEIRAKGWDEKQGAYVRSFGDQALDASLLMMPVVGFTSSEDPRWHSTLRAIGVGGVGEAGFDFCSLLFHMAVAGSGDVQRARQWFSEFLGRAGSTGLFGGEMANEGEQLGGFPQALTHLGVIWAAMALDAELDRAGSGVRG
ncbi:MAG: glycoside hydrolase family 15 protein [Catenulispora sp.]|nr:glycoside hydrolase family 15 protein [Catenulispora sp.]